MNNPNLIEPGIKSFHDNLLKKCQNKKEYIYNITFNVVLTLLFILALYFILKYKYKGKLTLMEKHIKTRKESEYVLSKIRQLQLEKAKQKNMITDLPSFEENEILLKNYYNNKV